MSGTRPEPQVGPQPVPPGPGRSDETRLGLLFALSSYMLWGFLPIYYKFTAEVGSDQVVAQRIVWSILSVGLYMLLMGRLGEVRDILRNRSYVLRLAASAAVISINWLVFIWAIGENRVLEISFGYFINPLINVALGIVLLGERLTKWQAAAVAVALCGILVQAVELGGVPWVSLTVACSFGLYAYLRKTVPVGASPGLLVEVLILGPFAMGFLVYLSMQGETVFTHAPGLWLLVAGTGVITAVPLILFAAGARRLPLKTIGLLQYLAPSIQFLLAVLVYGEPLDLPHLVSFVLIWISLAVYTFGSYRARPSAAPKAG